MSKDTNFQVTRSKALAFSTGLTLVISYWILEICYGGRFHTYLSNIQRDHQQGYSSSHATLAVSVLQWEDQRTLSIGYFRRMLKEMIQ